MQITAATVAINERAKAAGGKGLALSLDETDTASEASEDGVTLVFNRTNWFVPQTVYVHAPDDPLAEGTNGFNIIHRVQQGSSPKDGDAYDGLAVLGVVAMVVDDDAASVLIAPYADDDPLTAADDPDTDLFVGAVAKGQFGLDYGNRSGGNSATGHEAASAVFFCLMKSSNFCP